MNLKLDLSKSSVGSKSPSFSFWQILNTLLQQNEFDPRDKTRRFLFIFYLLFTFLLLSVALNDVGTKLVVTESHISKSLQDLYDLDCSNGLYIIEEDWPMAKFRDPTMKKVNQIYTKHCKSRPGQCGISHLNLFKMFADIAASSFKVVSELGANNMLSRFFCGSSLSLDNEHVKFVTVNLNELTTPGAVAYNSRITPLLRDIIKSAAMKILESGLVSDGLFQRAIDSDEEVLYSWRSCSARDPISDNGGQVRQITTNNFAWLAKFSAAVLLFLLIPNVLGNFLFMFKNNDVVRCKKNRNRGRYTLKHVQVTKNGTHLILSKVYK
ncbi:hypothetical protein HDE_02273 [Halotydeus destructor]|nr:hypothetical protein HDE_02273 [Halotydeus destructor]